MPPWKPDLYVMSRFLETLYLRHATLKKTTLQMAVRLNYDVFTKYLTWLEDKQLLTVTEQDGHHLVMITPKGIEVYQTIVTWIKKTIGP